MKKIFISALYIAVAIAVLGCAKEAKVGPNDANKRFLDAWLKLNHPEVDRKSVV